MPLINHHNKVSVIQWTNWVDLAFSEQKQRDIESLSSSEKEYLMDQIEEKVNKRINKETYNWESVG